MNPNIFCHKCGSSNKQSANYCIQCGTVLVKSDAGVEELRKEILLLKSEYELKFDRLLEKVNRLKIDREPLVNTKRESLLPPPAESRIYQKEDLKTESPSPPEEIKRPEYKTDPKRPAYIQQPKTDPVHQNLTPPEEVIEQPTLKERLKAIPLLATFFELIGSPLANAWDYISKFYYQYKEKNQLPVFFMTLSGIAALLFGFGYLMQLYIGHFGEISELVKIGFGFACSGGITWWATRLFKREEKYHDFSSALTGLAVALNYLFIYFLANMSHENPVFSNPLLGFLLIMANTVFAILIALRFETKIVAVLSLVGGAFAPFYLNSESSSPFYFVFLWLLCASSIYLSKKIKWKTLGTISFLTAATIIETAVITDINIFSILIYGAIFHAFAYLFIVFALFKGKSIKENLNKSSLLLIGANISLFIFNMYYLMFDTAYYSALGGVYLANALLFYPVLWIYNKTLSSKIRVLTLALCGIFVAFAIQVIFDQSLMGFFWSIEALALIFMGYIFSMPSVRKEGYVLLGIALLKIIHTFGDFWFINNTLLWSAGYLNLLAVGIILAILILLNNKYKTDHTSFENQLFTIVKNAVFGWFTLVYLVSAPYYLYNYTFVWAIIPMYGIIYAANKSKLVFGEFLGLGYGIILISGISYSAEQADSFRFALQPLWGKIVMAEVLISLWFLKLFYQKFLPASAHLKAMNVVREIFYWIVPLLILSPVNRHYPTYFETALWISTGISFGLNQLTKHKSLVMEVFALAAIATVLTLTQSENLWGVFSSIAILSALWISQKAHHPTRWLSSKYKSLLEIIPYYFAACIFVVTEAFLHSNSDACVATAIFLSSILLLQKHIAPMQKSLGFGFIVLLIVTGFSIGAKQLEHSGLPESVTLLPFIPIGLLIYLKNSIIRLKKLQLWSQSILVFHALLLIGYSFVFAKSVLTVAIILHAIILLFNSLKQNIKGMVWLSIAFFGVAVTKLYVWDIAHFTMIQKVLVFVLIGALLLGASYLFVKLKDNFEASKVNEQDLK